MSLSGFLASPQMNPAVPHILAAPIATTLASACASAADFISEKPESQRIVDPPLASPKPAKVWRLWARSPRHQMTQAGAAWHSVNLKGDAGNLAVGQAEERVLWCFKVKCLDRGQTDVKSLKNVPGNAMGYDDTRDCKMIGDAAQGAIPISMRSGSTVIDFSIATTSAMIMAVCKARPRGLENITASCG